MQIRCTAPKQDVVGKFLMAQLPTGASSAAREPSMEEILASIRRIIEESDTGRPDDILPLAVNSDVPPQPAAFSKPIEPYSEEAELAPREGIAVPRPAPQAFSAAPERPAPQAKPVEREVEHAADVPAAPNATWNVDSPPRDKLEDIVASATLKEASFAMTEQAKAPEAPVIAAPEPAIEQPEASLEDVSLDLERALEPILSESTERQVSAAFQDLSFAVRSEQRRSFDEIAQEMMRPLLQEWLDNNLPTLVERLVREEIERVARGSKR
jgi:cell pole-organizing protein PopZ